MWKGLAVLGPVCGSGWLHRSSMWEGLAALGLAGLGGVGCT